MKKKNNKFVKVNKETKDGRKYFFRSKPKKCTSEKSGLSAEKTD